MFHAMYSGVVKRGTSSNPIVIPEREPDAAEFPPTLTIVVITVFCTLVFVVGAWFCYRTLRRWIHVSERQPAGGQSSGHGRDTPPSYQHSVGMTATPAAALGGHVENPPNGTTECRSVEGRPVGLEVSVVQVDSYGSNPDSCDRNSTAPGSMAGPIENRLSQHQRDPSLRDLFSVSERSVTRVVLGKQLVVVAHDVDHRGDVLILDDTGISLTIPPGAILEGAKETICLALVWDLSDSPEIESRQALVSPVVYCGPHGLQLQKPCSLSYKHCAYDAGDIMIMVSETDLVETKDWRVLCEAQEVAGQCEVTQEECKVNLTHFSLLTCIQSRPSESPGKKWLQLGVFTSPLHKDIDHYQVRVYFLNKTPCALEWAIQNEAAFGGTKCCPEKVFLYDGDGRDMFLETVYVSDDWEVIDGCQLERISFLQIWHGHCPYVSICVRRKMNTRKRAEEINMHFLAYQENRANNPERLVIHMTEDHSMKRPDRGSSCCINPNHGEGRVTFNIQLDKTPHINLEEVNQSMSSIFVIPEELKQKLILLLDPTATFGNNWRQLAARLDLDGAIRFLETFQASPTMALLQYMEHRDMCLAKLHDILETMGRHDASRVVSGYIAHGGVEHQEPVENQPTEAHSD